MILNYYSDYNLHFLQYNMASVTPADTLISTYNLPLPNSDIVEVGIALCSGFKEPISFPTLLSHGLNLCILQANVVISTDSILQSVFKTLSTTDGKMKTKTISTEILYNLSPYKQIKQSLATFGVSKTPDKVWVVSVATESVAQINKFLEITQSLLVSEEAADVRDRGLIQEIYSVSPEELSIGSLEDAITNRIAVKDL